MIAARIGRLSPRAQELARVASVFAREFEFPVLQRAAALARRETAEAVEELVRRRIFDAVGERFDFTHSRLRQAVYHALLAPRQQALHAAIGEAVEIVYAGRLDEVYDRLAHHFSRADEPGRALTYLVHLGDKVARRYALDEAVRLLKDALAAAERLPRDAGGGRRLEVVYRLAHVLGLLGRPVEARDLLLRHEGLVADLGQPALSGSYHFWLAYTYGNLGDSHSAITHARRALEEAARAGDSVTMGKAEYSLSRESYMIGRPREGIAQGRQAVALLEQSDERWWLGQALGVLGLHLLHIGDFGPALEILDRMRALGEVIARLQPNAAWTIGRVHTIMGDADLAIAACRRAVELAADPVAQAGAIGWLGAAYLEGGDAGQAIDLLEDAIGRLQQLSGAGGYRYGQIDGMFRALLSEAYLAKGDAGRAGDLGAQALGIARAGGWGVAIGYAERAVGRVALNVGQLDEAEASVNRSLSTFVAGEALAQAARSRLPLAEIRAARGDKDTAAAELAAAQQTFQQMRAPILVERARRLATELGVTMEAEPRETMPERTSS
jgi:tetratricopeptide (TPR) repeat protein